MEARCSSSSSHVSQNGKSRLVNLVQNTLGNYATDLPTSFVTSKRNRSNAASPELMATKGVRFVTCQEPDSSESEAILNMGVSGYRRRVFALVKRNDEISQADHRERHGVGARPLQGPRMLLPPVLPFHVRCCPAFPPGRADDGCDSCRLTNDIPRFSDNSQGTWRRVKFLDMQTRFVQPSQIRHSFERAINATLDVRMKRWPPALDRKSVV